MAFNFGFFGKREHRVFNYRPRYYDPKEDEMKEKFGHLHKDKEEDAEKGPEQYVPGDYVKGSLRSAAYKKTKDSSKNQHIIGIISMVLFFIMLIYLVKFFNLLW